MTRAQRIGSLLFGAVVGSVAEAACVSDCGEIMLIEFPVGRYVERTEPPVLRNAELFLSSDEVYVVYETEEGHEYQVTYSRAE